MPYYLVSVQRTMLQNCRVLVDAPDRDSAEDQAISDASRDPNVEWEDYDEAGEYIPIAMEEVD